MSILYSLSIYKHVTCKSLNLSLLLFVNLLFLFKQKVSIFPFIYHNMKHHVTIPHLDNTHLSTSKLSFQIILTLPYRLTDEVLHLQMYGIKTQIKVYGIELISSLYLDNLVIIYSYCLFSLFLLSFLHYFYNEFCLI